MSSIYLMGDIHGSATDFQYRVEQFILEASEEDIIICLGDVGIKYGEYFQGMLRKQMSKFPGTIYILRGNHDCRYWRDLQNNEKCVIENNLLFHKKYGNIKYINDSGGLYNIQNNNILFIPGAYSVDKYYRYQHHLSYEEEEQLTWQEQNDIIDLCKNNHIDYVCSHTAPFFTQRYYKDLFLDFIDQSQVDNNMEKFLDEVYNIIGKNVKRWYFGHYHDDRNVSTNFTMLYNKVVKLGEKL